MRSCQSSRSLSSWPSPIGGSRWRSRPRWRYRPSPVGRKPRPGAAGRRWPCLAGRSSSGFGARSGFMGGSPGRGRRRRALTMMHHNLSISEELIHSDAIMSIVPVTLLLAEPHRRVAMAQPAPVEVSPVACRSETPARRRGETVAVRGGPLVERLRSAGRLHGRVSRSGPAAASVDDDESRALFVSYRYGELGSGVEIFLPHGDGVLPWFGVGARSLLADFTPRGRRFR